MSIGVAASFEVRSRTTFDVAALCSASTGPAANLLNAG